MIPCGAQTAGTPELGMQKGNWFFALVVVLVCKLAPGQLQLCSCARCEKGRELSCQKHTLCLQARVPPGKQLWLEGGTCSLSRSFCHMY